MNLRLLKFVSFTASLILPFMVHASTPSVVPVFDIMLGVEVDEIMDISMALLIAVILGAILGIERRLAHKTAGMRTFAMVSLGAALFTILSQGGAAAGNFDFDPTRIASQIVVGIGFLGAGIIIFHKFQIQGLTTAASLWVAAGIGMAVGFGFYLTAAVATILALAVLIILWFFEHEVEQLEKNE